MEKTGRKCRDIIFRSLKNGSVLCVHSRMARNYAELLEQDEKIKGYAVSVPLEKSRYQYVKPVQIRKSYFDTEWASDFMVYYADGGYGIRELIQKELLTKQAVIEKLEFSRRYWSASEAKDWKIVVVEVADVY